MKISKRRLSTLSVILAMWLSGFGCTVNSKEAALAKEASDRFYVNFSKTSDLASFQNEFDLSDSLSGIDKLLDKLRIAKTVMGEIQSWQFKSLELKNTDEKSFAVCGYKVIGDKNAHYQQIVWRLKNGKPSLADVRTFNYNEKGELMLLVEDGKIIF